MDAGRSIDARRRRRAARGSCSPYPPQRRGAGRAGGGGRGGRRTGGAGEPGMLDLAIAALRSGGRCVVNAVTLETEALLMAQHLARGGELVRIAISRTSAVGEKTGWRSAMPVTQWIWTKP